jgi:tetratricopeptide (TPR) repeat protein
VQTDYGNALAKSGCIPEVIAHCEAALRVLPDSPITHHDLANALAATPGSVPEAIAEYQTVLRIKPDYEEARNNLAHVQSNAAEIQYSMDVDLAKSRKPEAAIPHFEEALRLKPDYVDAHNNLGVVLAGAGRVQEAISHFEAALRIDPDSADAHVNLWDCVIGDTRPNAGGHPAFRSGVAYQARPGDPANAGSSRKTAIAAGRRAPPRWLNFSKS